VTVVGRSTSSATPPCCRSGRGAHRAAFVLRFRSGAGRPHRCSRPRGRCSSGEQLTPRKMLPGRQNIARPNSGTVWPRMPALAFRANAETATVISVELTIRPLPPPSPWLTDRPRRLGRRRGAPEPWDPDGPVRSSLGSTSLERRRTTECVVQLARGEPPDHLGQGNEASVITARSSRRDPSC